jgi:hypothetical protein
MAGSAQLLPVRISRPAASSPLELRSVSGWSLHVDGGVYAVWLARLLQLAAAKDLARLREQDWNKQCNEAIENANSCDQNIRTLAAGSTGASLSLRDILAAVSRGVPDPSVETLTTTLAAVLQDCQSQYRELAEKADLHASDTVILEQAWPTEPPSLQPL